MASSEAPISINLKTAGGTGITLRAESAEQFADMIAQSIHTLVDAVAEVETAVRGNNPAPMPVKSVAAALGATIIDNSIGGGRNCPHGRMTAIQGTGKDGSMYRGYFCPAPKGSFDKCKNVYLKTTDSAWNTFVPDQVK